MQLSTRTMWKVLQKSEFSIPPMSSTLTNIQLFVGETSGLNKGLQVTHARRNDMAKLDPMATPTLQCTAPFYCSGGDILIALIYRHRAFLVTVCIQRARRATQGHYRGESVKPSRPFAVWITNVRRAQLSRSSRDARFLGGGCFNSSYSGP